MTIRPIGVTLATILFLSVSVSASRAQTGSEADSAAIKQMIASNTDAFNHHDPHALVTNFAEDADFTNMRGVSRHGRKEVEAMLTPLFTNGALKNANRTITVRNIRFLTPTIAAVDMDSVLVGTTGPGGKENPPRKGLVNDLLTKQNGQWMITVFHELDYPEAPGTPGK